VDRLRRAWSDRRVTFEAAEPPERSEGEDYRAAWLDWAEFTNSWWLRYADWAGGLMKAAAPEKLFLVRFGWPVFQAENVFLAPQARHVDLVQCKDGVASWEVGHPGYQLSRTAIYFGACRRSDKIVFPELDIIHGRGYKPGELTRYLPLVAHMAGAIWYYRGLQCESAEFMADMKRAVAETKAKLARKYPPAQVGIFYSLKYANWISPHNDYGNERALVGCTELLEDLGVRYAVISEFNLEQLSDYKAVIVPYNPAVSESAVNALRRYVARGGGLLVEAEAGVYDCRPGKVARRSGTLPFAKVQVLSRERSPCRFELNVSGLGLRFHGSNWFTTLTERIRARGSVIGTLTDGSPAMVLGNSRSRTLYVAFRFFEPYSFQDDEAVKRQKQRLVRAFFQWCGAAE